MDKRRAQVTYLLMALTVLAMVILILNHLAAGVKEDVRSLFEP